ncbi:hypothetical protein AKJ16_DCAP22643, partial [Drosera capensis]
MDNSLCLAAEPPDEEEEEESGWTQYLEDFLPVHTYEPKQGRLSGVAEKKGGDDINNVTAMDASLMSDAGSGPEWKKNRIVMYGNKFVLKKVNYDNTGMMSGREVIPLDDSLEDTASSPVNSPKIALCFKRMDIMNPRKLCPDESTEGYPEKTGDSESGAVLKGSGGGKIDHGCSGADQLKKKGFEVSRSMKYTDSGASHHVTSTMFPKTIGNLCDANICFHSPPELV